DMSYHHYSSVSSAKRFNVSEDMLLILSFSIKKLKFSPGKGLVKMSDIVEEGEPVDAAGSRATTSVIGAMTLGAGKSTLGEGVSNLSNSG
nr:hypothetical protein [Tanacetum cinerariifolium]